MTCESMILGMCFLESPFSSRSFVFIESSVEVLSSLSDAGDCKVRAFDLVDCFLSAAGCVRLCPQG